jgi:hypothetical protein
VGRATRATPRHRASAGASVEAAVVQPCATAARTAVRRVGQVAGSSRPGAQSALPRKPDRRARRNRSRTELASENQTVCDVAGPVGEVRRLLRGVVQHGPVVTGRESPCLRGGDGGGCPVAPVAAVERRAQLDLARADPVAGVGRPLVLGAAATPPAWANGASRATSTSAGAAAAAPRGTGSRRRIRGLSRSCQQPLPCAYRSPARGPEPWGQRRVRTAGTEPTGCRVTHGRTWSVPGSAVTV